MRPNDTDEVKLSTEIPFRMEELKTDRYTPNLSAIIGMVKPALEAHTTSGTKKKKASFMSYWGSYFPAYNIDFDKLGKMSKEIYVESTRRSQKEWEEMQFLAEFASYFVLFPRRKNQTYNSTGHSERAIVVFKVHYQSLNGRVQGKYHLVDYGDRIKKVLKGLAKIRPSTTQKRLPLMPSNMRGIIAVMKLDYLEKATLWALWLAQWQVVMIFSDILRLVDLKGLKWELTRGTHIGRIRWEDVDPKTYH